MMTMNMPNPHFESAIVVARNGRTQRRVATFASSYHIGITCFSPRGAYGNKCFVFCCILVYIVPQIRTDFLPLPTRDESIHLGYWILLTAIYVCQPNYSATKKRLIQRIFGTIAGVLVGSALILLKLSLEVKLVLIVVMLSLFFLFRTNKHSFSTLFITIQAILSFSIAGYDVNQFFVPRVVDTMVGAVISGQLCIFCGLTGNMWLWIKQVMPRFKSNAGYLNAVLDELHQYNQIDSLEYRQARRNAQDSAAALSSMLSDMSGDVQNLVCA